MTAQGFGGTVAGALGLVVAGMASHSASPAGRFRRYEAAP